MEKKVEQPEMPQEKTPEPVIEELKSEVVSSKSPYDDMVIGGMEWRRIKQLLVNPLFDNQKFFDQLTQ